MRVVVVTPPDPVIELEEAKDHLGVDSDDSDTPIELYVAAATAHIDGPDGWLGRAIGVQTLEARLPAFGSTSIGLPYPPAIDIVGIGYVASDGQVASLATDAVELTGNLLRPTWPSSFPTPQWRGADGDVVRIQYRAGYEDVPPAIKAAILLMTGDLFRNRDTVAATAAAQIPMSTTVANLLAPFRVWR